MEVSGEHVRVVGPAEADESFRDFYVKQPEESKVYKSVIMWQNWLGNWSFYCNIFDMLCTQEVKLTTAQKSLHLVLCLCGHARKSDAHFIDRRLDTNRLVS